MDIASEPLQDTDRKIEVSLRLDAELLNQLSHLTNDPSRVVEAAVRQWLRGTVPREDDIARAFPRNPPVPARGEWND